MNARFFLLLTVSAVVLFSFLFNRVDAGLSDEDVSLGHKGWAQEEARLMKLDEPAARTALDPGGPGRSTEGLMGTVRDRANGGHAVSGVRIQFYDASLADAGEESALLGETESAVDGSYQFVSDGVGLVAYVFAEHAGYYPVLVPAVGPLCDVELLRRDVKSRVVGSVSRADGEPIERFALQLSSADDGNVISGEEVQWRPGGRIDLEVDHGRDEESCDLVIEAPGFIVRSVPLDLAYGLETEIGEITLGELRTGVSGVVVEAGSHAAIEGAQVMSYSWSDAMAGGSRILASEQEVTTGPEGRFRIDSLAQDSLGRIEVWAPGFAHRSIGFQPGEQPPAGDLVIELQRGFTLSGSLAVRPSGDLPTAVAWRDLGHGGVIMIPGRSAVYSPIDDAGRFELNHLSQGAWMVGLLDGSDQRGGVLITHVEEVRVDNDSSILIRNEETRRWDVRVSCGSEYPDGARLAFQVIDQFGAYVALGYFPNDDRHVVIPGRSEGSFHLRVFPSFRQYPLDSALQSSDSLQTVDYSDAFGDLLEDLKATMQSK